MRFNFSTASPKPPCCRRSVVSPSEIIADIQMSRFLVRFHEIYIFLGESLTGTRHDPLRVKGCLADDRSDPRSSLWLFRLVLEKEKRAYTPISYSPSPSDNRIRPVPLFHGFVLRRVRFPRTQCCFRDARTLRCASSYATTNDVGRRHSLSLLLFPRFLPLPFRDDTLYIKHSLYSDHDIIHFCIYVKRAHPLTQQCVRPCLRTPA